LWFHGVLFIGFDSFLTVFNAGGESFFAVFIVLVDAVKMTLGK